MIKLSPAFMEGLRTGIRKGLVAGYFIVALGVFGQFYVDTELVVDACHKRGNTYTNCTTGHLLVTAAIATTWPLYLSIKMVRESE